jgi:hypothetical protein
LFSGFQGTHSLPSRTSTVCGTPAAVSAPFTACSVSGFADVWKR